MLFYRIFSITFLILSLSAPVLAGELADFKVSALQENDESVQYKSKSKNNKNNYHRHDDNNSDQDDEDHGSDLWGAFFDVLSMGAGGSVDRLYREDDSRRMLGEALIPFVRLDVSQQAVNSNIDADNYRFEMGWGPVAVQFAKTSYTEASADDQLDLASTVFLLRSSLGEAVEIDLGVGLLNIDNSPEDARFLVTIPILIHPNDYLGIELRPAWTDRINDMDTALLIGSRYISLKLGYRQVATSSISLDGPYIGLSLRY